MSTKTEKPIIFSGPMIKAILAGKKSQTRRVMTKNLPFLNERGTWEWYPAGKDYGYHAAMGPTPSMKVPQGWARSWCPYGGPGLDYPGDRLWVRETWAKDIPGCPNGISYRADHQGPRGDGPANPIKWRPSIFMPRGVCRIKLEVVGVLIERLREITWRDALAEGVTIPVGPDGGVAIRLTGKCPPCKYIKRDATSEENIIGHFASLWDSINGSRPGCSWSDNPWVWCIQFRLAKGSQ